MNFLSELKEQRWDDHRFYHRSRVNQALHLLSAISFIIAMVMLWINPIYAALTGWIIAMIPRQIGHFFFEPKEYDDVNHVTHEYKESIKIGYNLRRKVIFISLWAICPVVLFYNPTWFGYFDPSEGLTFMYRLSVVWIGLAIAALIFRTIHLFFIKDIVSGIAWATKILTDPFHDIKLYHKSPFYLLKGEWFDPMYPEEELKEAS